MSAPTKQLVCWEEAEEAEEKEGEENDAGSSGGEGERRGGHDRSLLEMPVVRFISASSLSHHDIVYIHDLSAAANKKRKRKKGEAHGGDRDRGGPIDGGLLVVYRDGHIRLFEPNLQYTLWDFSASSVEPDTGKVVYAATSGSAAASCRRLFDGRPDIAVNSSDINILLVVTMNMAAFDVQFIAVPDAMTASSSRHRPRELLSLRLPPTCDDDVSGPSSSTFSMHFSTGTLFRLSSTRLTTYNLAGPQPPAINTSLPVQPKRDAEAAVAVNPPPSLLRITSSTVLVATSKGIALYDTRFSSLRASLPFESKRPPAAAQFSSSAALSRSSTPASATAAATAAADDIQGGVSLSAYLPDMDLAIGYSSQSGVVGIQLARLRTAATTRRRSTAGLLIGSLGRGVEGEREAAIKNGKLREQSSRHFFTRDLGQEKLKRESAIAKLQDARASNRVTAFEHEFAQFVGVRLRKGKEKGKGKAEPSSLKEGRPPPPISGGPSTAGGTLRSLDEEDSVPVKQQQQQHPLLATAAAAAAESSGGDNAASGFEIPERLYKPLPTEFVRAVLSMVFEVTEPGDDRNHNYDYNLDYDHAPTMAISFFPTAVISYLLESGNFSTTCLPLNGGLVGALHGYDPTLRTLQWFLTALSDFPVAEIESAINLALSPSTAAPEGEDNVVFEIHRAEIVRIALIRLSTFPASTVVQSFRSLPSNTVALLIRLLENELRTGDCKQDFEEPGKRLGLEDVRIVADLLTAAIDAIGISGVLATEIDTDINILTGLMENVNDAVAVMSEATSLKGLVEELFRHVDWRKLSEASAQPLLTAPAAPRLNNNSSNAVSLKKKPSRRPPSYSDRRNRREQQPDHGLALATRADRDRRKLALVAHKTMLQRSAPTSRVSRSELIKLDRPVALRATQQGVSPILQLGGAARQLALGRMVVDPLAAVGRRKGDQGHQQQYDGIVRTMTMRAEYQREGLAAGTYSIESMVV